MFWIAAKTKIVILANLSWPTNRYTHAALPPSRNNNLNSFHTQYYIILCTCSLSMKCPTMSVSSCVFKAMLYQSLGPTVMSEKLSQILNQILKLWQIIFLLQTRAQHSKLLLKCSVKIIIKLVKIQKGRIVTHK